MIRTSIARHLGSLALAWASASASTATGCKPSPSSAPPTSSLPPPPLPTACAELGQRLCAELELDCDDLADVLREHEPTPALCEESLEAVDAIDTSEQLEPALRQVAHASLLAATLRRSPKAARDTLERLEQLSVQRALSDGDGPQDLEDLEDALRRVTRHYEDSANNSAELMRTEAELEELLERYPDEPRALVLLAQVELELGRVDEALATARHCSEIDPAQADCWLTIGVLEESASNREAALDAYRSYLRLEPDGRYAPQVRRALERVGP